jgi:predicted ATP-grasp superfamily ATP-dependent carboligase
MPAGAVILRKDPLFAVLAQRSQEHIADQCAQRIERRRALAREPLGASDVRSDAAALASTLRKRAARA